MNRSAHIHIEIRSPRPGHGLALRTSEFKTLDEKEKHIHGAVSTLGALRQFENHPRRIEGDSDARRERYPVPVKLGYPHIESTAAGTSVFQSWTLGSDHS